MRLNKNVAKENKHKIEWHDKWVDIVLGIILAIIALIPLPEAILNLFKDLFYEENYYMKIIANIVSLAIVAVILFLYWYKVVLHRNSAVVECNYKRERKVNLINHAVFESISALHSAKVREIFRYTYGTVPVWNPINYRNNVIVYDVHEQIRSILISIEKVVISIDPKRFNDQNVSVELVYCYPGDTDDEGVKCDRDKMIKLPIDRSFINTENHPWKLISSGDTSGNHQSVLEHLSQRDSFFTLVDCCGTVFKNDKFSEIKDYQKNLVKERLNNLPSENLPSEKFFIEDIRDWERSKMGKCKGSAIGTVIDIRNDNPEDIFVKAILTINTYGDSIFESSSENHDQRHKKKERDGFSLTEGDYKDIFCNTILSTFTKLLETELVVQKVRIQNNSRAGFPYGCVVILDGRQPICVLRLALRKSCSETLFSFLTFCTTSANVHPPLNPRGEYVPQNWSRATQQKKSTAV